MPSAIHGIGVFAIRTIPKASIGFFLEGRGRMIELSFEEVKRTAGIIEA